MKRSGGNCSANDELQPHLMMCGHDYLKQLPLWSLASTGSLPKRSMLQHNRFERESTKSGLDVDLSGTAQLNPGYANQPLTRLLLLLGSIA